MSDEPRQNVGEGDGEEPWELEPREGDAAPGSGNVEVPRVDAGVGAGRPRPRIEAESILELAEEKCPKCGAVLGVNDVVCMKCGYDLRVSAVREVEQRVEHVEEDAGGDAAEPFVTPGRGTPKALVIAGAVVTVAAMVAAGMGVPVGQSGWVVVAAVLLVLYEVVVHTGTGLVAVAAAARISEERFGGEEAVPLAAARVFLAMAVFELVLNLVAFTPYVGPWIAPPVAVAAYWLVVWGLFNKTRTVALVIVLTQVILWVLVRMGMELGAWYHAVPAAAAP